MADLDQLKDWFRESEDMLQVSRGKAEKDRDFFDGKQHTAEEIIELERRNQPVVTINRIQPKVNFIYGQEVRTRVDPRAFPRTPAHEDDAIIVTDMLRAVADQIKFDRLRGAAFKYVAVEGIGGAVFSVTKRSGRPFITADLVPFDRFFYDPHSRLEDFSDALYMGIVMWKDLEDAKRDKRWRDKPMAIEALEMANNAGNNSLGDTYDDKPLWWDAERNRVRIVEIYYREGEDWFRAFYCGGGFLIEPAKVPFVDEYGETYCPLIMASGAINREFERYGIVRAMISPQEEINKRRSKALHLLSFRQVIAESNAFEDEQEAQIELAKPDGFIRVRKNVLNENRILINNTGDLAQGHVALGEQSKNDIDQTGPHAALVGASQRDLSGRSILAQLDAGSQELAPLFDNLRDWTLRCYRVLWYMVRQFYKKEDYVRVRDDSGKGYRFIPINRRMTKAQRVMDLIQNGGHAPEEAISLTMGFEGMQAFQGLAQEMQAMAQQVGVPVQPQQLLAAFLQSYPGGAEPFTQNDVAALDVDLVLETVPDTAVAEHEEFLEMIKLAGQGVAIPPRALIEASSLRSKRKILAELDKPPPPQVIEQQKLQLAALKAEVDKTVAEAQKTLAQAAEAQSKAEQGVPAEATRDEAHAVKLLAEADAVQSQPPEKPDNKDKDK